MQRLNTRRARLFVICRLVLPDACACDSDRGLQAISGKSVAVSRGDPQRYVLGSCAIHDTTMTSRVTSVKDVVTSSGVTPVSNTQAVRVRAGSRKPEREC